MANAFFIILYLVRFILLAIHIMDDFNECAFAKKTDKLLHKLVITIVKSYSLE